MNRLRDTPRPSVYWPNTPTQWREPSVDDCTWHSTEFAFQAASRTHLNMHPVKDLRNKSIDTVGGTTLRVALSETHRLWPKSEGAEYRYGAFSKTEIRRALMDGKTIVYGGDYEKLPQHYRRWTNNDTFDHAMASRDFRTSGNGEQTFLYDPLGGGPQREPYNGEWIALSDLLKFNWSDRSGREYVGIVYGTAQSTETGDTMIKGTMERTSNRYVDVPKGTAIYDSPRGKVVKTLVNARRLDFFGYSGDWWCIEIVVGAEQVLAYIRKDESFPRGDWPSEVPIGTDPAARIVQLEASLASISNAAISALQGT